VAVGEVNGTEVEMGRGFEGGRGLIADDGFSSRDPAFLQRSLLSLWGTPIPTRSGPEIEYSWQCNAFPSITQKGPTPHSWYCIKAFLSEQEGVGMPSGGKSGDVTMEISKETSEIDRVYDEQLPSPHIQELCAYFFFEACLREEKRQNQINISLATTAKLAHLLSGLGDLASLAVSLLDALDDTDSDRLHRTVSTRSSSPQRRHRTYLSHVTDGETTKGRVLLEGLDTHGLAGDHLDNGSVTALDELGARLDDLARSPVDLLVEGVELAGNVGGVAVKDGCVTGTDLTGVVEDDDLGDERSGLLGGVVLAVRGNVTSANVLDRDVLDAVMSCQLHAGQLKH
jgi:hypothetical protein